MAYTVPTTEPEEFFLGDTVTWTKVLSDYPASVWTLKYNCVSNDAGAGNETTTAVADGDTHVITMAKAATAATSTSAAWAGQVVSAPMFGVGKRQSSPTMQLWSGAIMP